MWKDEEVAIVKAISTGRFTIVKGLKYGWDGVEHGTATTSDFNFEWSIAPIGKLGEILYAK